MGRLGDEVLSAARRRLDTSFRHHFKPINLCDGGRLTIESCMRRGLGPGRYDCSGLAIASICDVLDIPTDRWPRHLRHMLQLESLAQQVNDFEPGDLRMFYSKLGRYHIGIAADEQQAIHASGLSGVVEEGIVVDEFGRFESDRSIAIDSLYNVLALLGTI